MSTSPPAPRPGLPPATDGPTAQHRSRPRDEDRPTRRPLEWWDRVKFLLLLGIAYLVVVWNAIASMPPLAVTFRESAWLGLQDAILLTAGSGRVLAVLAGIELLRQLHYLVSERSAAYHRFWTQRVFGRFERRLQRMSDWTRFRITRVLKLLVVVVVLSVVLGALLHVPPTTALFEAPARFVAALPFILQLAFGFFFIIFQFIGLFWFLSRGGTDVYFPDDIKTRFEDVWGQDSVLEKIRENLVFLEDPEAIEDRGGYVPGGILLWGPPGTGKTLMAEAVAGETGKPFVFVDPGAFQNMFLGVGILKVKALFRKARKLALRYGGVILFFDEADSLGSRGALAQPGPGGSGATPAPWHAGDCHGFDLLDPVTKAVLARDTLSTGAPRRTTRDRIIMGGMGGGGMGTLNALLTELSGLKKPRGFFNRIVRRALGLRPKPPPKYRIMVMMATNLPQALDEALLRPGRLDRIYKVGYPSKAGRLRTYGGYLAKVRHELTDEQVDRLATITPYATGATIKDLVNEALINAIRDGREVINWRDVVKAKQLKDLGPPEDVEYIERERHAVAIHEACHAVTAYRVRHHLTIDIATIEKGGTYLGMVASIPPEDQFTRWRSEYEADIMVSLASLAGERRFFDGDNSSGVSGDLETATRLATMMEGYWGMGASLSSHGVTRQAGIPGGARPGEGEDGGSGLLDSSLGERIEEKLAALLARCEALLAENRLEVLAVAHALESNKTVTGEDVAAIIDGRPGPLLDGSLYRTETFRVAAEDYHRSALAAHKRHARIPVPLPQLAPVGVGGITSGDGHGTELGGTAP
ncbi:AAA family ATPase [Egicoccus sp. AB-alg2]|uniref:AAA family ATPase n=1 Tax=Egicoccus sp. AB-alg2 TaxID=3242693 RepID=UPI00359EF920